MTARDWLKENGYDDIVALIDEVLADLKAKGSKERRNWWEILAGGRNGKPLKVAGREFPVLYAAQKRQGKTITANAIRRKKMERPPPVRETGRWSNN
jgi:hypothetical protein